MRKPAPPLPEPTMNALQVCEALCDLDVNERSRALALFVGMQEVEPGVFRADLSILSRDRVVAVATLAQLVPMDCAKGTLVYCFPGLPPR